MTPQPLRVAIIGPGKVGHLHAKAALQAPNTELVAVCGRNREKAEAFAQPYGIQPYTDIAQMVAQAQIDICIVCTPHPAHRDPTVAALEAGAHVLVEKPLASSLEDCVAMLEASRRRMIGSGSIICLLSCINPKTRARSGDSYDGVIFVSTWTRNRIRQTPQTCPS